LVFTKSRRHPSVAKYIFTNKEGTDIIDLEQTSAQIESISKMLFEAGAQGKTVLFVSTKPEASVYVAEVAKRIAMPYVTNRWIGGMLTNYPEIRKRIERYKALVQERESGEMERKYIKKERVVIGREIDKLEFNFGGIIGMDRTPHFMVVVDPRHDAIAVQEAIDMKVPVIGIMSSDCDAKKVTYPVVVNDALKASIVLALEELSSAYEEGRKTYTAPVTQRVRPVRTEHTRRPRTADRRA
jgi:small subunit ribosomal protein S2